MVSFIIPFSLNLDRAIRYQYPLLVSCKHQYNKQPVFLAIWSISLSNKNEVLLSHWVVQSIKQVSWTKIRSIYIPISNQQYMLTKLSILLHSLTNKTSLPISILSDKQPKTVMQRGNNRMVCWCTDLRIKSSKAF